MPPVTGDLDVGRVVLMEEKNEQEPQAMNLGTTYNPTRATVSFFPSDCNGQPAIKRVTLTWLDGDAATVTRGYSPYSGGAIAINLPINAARITRIVARVAETNQLIGVANAVIRAKSNAEVRFAPAP